MESCEIFLDQIRQNNLVGWITELTSTFSNFSINPAYGNYFDFGNFKKCINFDSNGFIGKYCSVQYYSKLSDVLPAIPNNAISSDWKNTNKRLSGAVCIPSICDPNEVVPKLMEILLNGTKYAMADDYNQREFCQVKKNFKFTASGLFGLSIIFILTAMIIYSTIKNYKKKSKFFGSFCIVQNFKNLFIDENRDGTTHFIRGIKAMMLSSSFIIHTFMFAVYLPTNDPENVIKFYSQTTGFLSTIVINGPTFFFLASAFIATRIFWKILEKKGSISLWKVYLYRYLRMTPIMFSILFVQKFIMEGWVAENLQRPAFYPDVAFRKYKYFWLPLLHIQNYFIDIFGSPFLGIYYFAVDFQLFLMTPIVVYLIWRYRYLVYILLPGIFIIGAYFNIAYIFKHADFFGNMKYLAYEDKILSQYSQQTEFALTAWSTGMLIGYVTQNYDIKLKKNFEKFLIAITSTAAAFYFLKGYINLFEDYRIYDINFDKIIIHNGVPALFILTLYFGSHNAIHKLFSSKFWIPFDRLGFCFFAAQMNVFNWFLYWQMDYFRVSFSSVVIQSLPIGLISLFLAIIVNLMVEQPISNLNRLFFK